uniref:Large ribosomal subunit protein mL54 n=1 Tax=Hemiselmis andersenii TaxID=464988 RepID=A0A7S1DTT5_HEMAN
MSALWAARWARNGGLIVRSTVPTLRMAAPKKAPAKAKAAEDEAAAPAGEIKVGSPIPGVNFLKDGKDPVYKEESEYPEWLFKLLDPKPTLRELNIKFDEEGPEALSTQEYQRMLRLMNRGRIKEHNMAKSKK